jgi:hypothetical protein
MSLIGSIVEKVAVGLGEDPEDAHKLGDLVSLGANLAMQNYAGAAADGLDLTGMADEVPWLEQGLAMAGGDPLSGGAGPGGGMPPGGIAV